MCHFHAQRGYEMQLRNKVCVIIITYIYIIINYAICCVKAKVEMAFRGAGVPKEAV